MIGIEFPGGEPAQGHGPAAGKALALLESRGAGLARPGERAVSRFAWGPLTLAVAVPSATLQRTPRPPVPAPPGAPGPLHTAPYVGRPVRMAGYDSYAHTREHARHLPQAPREILSDRPRPVSVWESVRRSNTARPCGNRLVDPFRSQQEHGMEYGFADRPEPASAPGCLDRGRGGEPACRRMWAAGQPVPAGEAAESAGVGPTSAMAPGRKRATGQQASTRHAAPAANPGSRRRSKIQRRGQPKWLPRCRR